MLVLLIQQQYQIHIQHDVILQLKTKTKKKRNVFNNIRVGHPVGRGVGLGVGHPILMIW